MTAEAGMQLAQNLSMLTRLTYLSLTDGGHLGNLPQLTALRKLHTLHVCNWGQAPHRGQHLAHLRELHILGVHAIELDLSSCTQLVVMHLDVDDNKERPLRHLLLPFGPDERLKDLELCSVQTPNPLVLENLSLAPSLTHVSFSGVYAKNLMEGDWPCSLAHLERLSFSNCVYTLPQQFVGYRRLSDMSLNDYAPKHLPDWFSGLTQLTSLEVQDCNFMTFPLGVLNLSKLTNLAIRNYPALRITKDIMQISTWRCLQSFDLRVRGPIGSSNLETYSLDSQLYLLELCQCLNANGVATDVSYDEVDDFFEYSE